MGLILLTNFSWISFGVLVLIAGVSIYVNVFRADGAVAKHITVNIRYYIIMSVLFIECVYLINNLSGFDFVHISEAFGEYIKSFFDEIGAYWNNRTSDVILWIILSIICAIVKKRVTSHSFIHTVLDYQFTVTVFSVLIFALTDNKLASAGYILVAFFFVLGDVFRRLYDDERKLGFKVGKRSLSGLSVGLLLICTFNPLIKLELMTFELGALVELFSRWSIFLFLFIVSVATFVLVAFIDTRLKNGSAYEKYFLLTVASVLPIIFVSARVCFSYRWTLFAGIILLIIACVTRIGPSTYGGKKEYTKENFYTMPIISVASVFMILEAQYGKLLIAAVFVISTWILVSSYKKLAFINDETAKSISGISSTMIWIYVNTLSRLLMFHNNSAPIAILTVVTVVLLVILRIANHNPEIYESNMHLKYGQFILPAVLLLVCLTVFSQGGSDIDIDIEDGFATITVEADGKDNSIVKAQYRWCESLPELVQDAVGSVSVPSGDVSDELLAQTDEEPETEEYFDVSDKPIELRNGLLKVVVEDRYGVVTVTQVWCSVEE